MTLDRILPFARHLLEKCIVTGDVVVDATCGNGNDTLFLANLVGRTGKVYGFDVQQMAVNNTKQRLIEHGHFNTDVILDGHEHVLRYISQEISGAIFNLGYLPGSDMSITTHSKTTWKAVTDLLSLLKKNGVIVLVIYHGHAEGKKEREELEELIANLDNYKTSVLRYEFLNKNNAPYIIAIEKVN